MWVWMKPGSRYAPPASIVVSCLSGGAAPTETMRPSRTDTAPSTMSSASFIVRMVALVMSVELAGGTSSGRPLERCAGDILAVPHRDQLGKDRDGDFRRGDRADVEPDRRVDAAQAFDRHAFLLERLEDARDLGPAADQADVAQIARGERAQCFEVVGVAAGHDHRVGGRRQVGAMQPRADIVD